MRKLMTVALALAFLGTTTAVCFAQETPKKQNTKNPKGSKKKAAKKK